MKTLIAVVLDESESMDGYKKNEAINGYNCFIDEQKANKVDDAKFYLVKFSRYSQTIHSGIAMDTVPCLTETTYVPNGSTALFDAIVSTIQLVDRQKQSDERVICVIITDGGENCSRFANKEQVKEMIKRYTDRGDWTFVYIGDEAQRLAVELNISPKNAINFCHEKGKVKANFEVASKACSNLRSNKVKASKSLVN